MTIKKFREINLFWTWFLIYCIFSAADRFSLNGLKSLAIFELSSGLTKDNVVDIYVDVISALPIIGKLVKHWL
jgi:hypothetical protein